MSVPYRSYSGNYNSTDRKEYYVRSIFPERISLFLDLWKKEKAHSIPVNKSVSFRGLTFGCSPQAVTSMIGKPRYILENHGMSTQVFFYKEQFHKYRVITQAHFRGQEFFYAAYSFKDLGVTDRKLIRTILFEKYSASLSGPVGLFETITDAKENIIAINDNVNFYVLYLWGDAKIKKAVTESNYALQFGGKEVMQQKMEELRSKL